jgi:hypothetical protein
MIRVFNLIRKDDQSRKLNLIPKVAAEFGGTL